ncbi:MAG: hypothetical protein L0Y72_26555 [Gemmataceae bacterium]|nr:hypothetical protein [Gemmataceae bacterium]MCI0742610.1 hypothetical protein [Gemmataceae bacterium]
MKAMIPALALASLFLLRAGSEARGQLPGQVSNVPGQGQVGNLSADLQPQDKWYTVVFGVQDGRNRFHKAHSFATFVRARKAPKVQIVDQATISWLPASGIVDLRRPPEKGTNHPLRKSLQDVHPGCAIAQWGPYEIREELFVRAKRQAKFLDSGGVLYKAVDFNTRPAGVAINCEHAVIDIARDRGQPFVRTFLARGHWGSSLVAEHLRGFMIEPNVVHDWLNGPLELDQHPIEKKGL